MDKLMINIANDFSAYPAGRTVEDGPNSGARFRDECLRPMLEQAIKVGATVTVSFDGLKVCGSSFLDSAFGGLVRNCGLNSKAVMKHLELVAEGPQFERYIESAIRYIRSAKP